MDQRPRIFNSSFRQSRKPMSRVSDRREREWERAYGSEARVRWVQSLPCLVHDCRGWPIDNAHIETGGTGRKADADRIVPLCRAHHLGGDQSLHRLGREGFEVLHGLDLEQEAAAVERRWRLRSEDA